MLQVLVAGNGFASESLWKGLELLIHMDTNGSICDVFEEATQPEMLALKKIKMVEGTRHYQMQVMVKATKAGLE